MLALMIPKVRSKILDVFFSRVFVNFLLLPRLNNGRISSAVVDVQLPDERQIVLALLQES